MSTDHMSETEGLLAELASAPRMARGELLDWLSDEGMLDWVTVETGDHG